MNWTDIRTKSRRNSPLIDDRITLNSLIAEYGAENSICLRQTFAAFVIIHERLTRLGIFRDESGFYSVKLRATISLEPYFRSTEERGILASFIEYADGEGVRQTLRLLSDLAEESSAQLFTQFNDAQAESIAQREGFVPLGKSIFWRAKADLNRRPGVIIG